jgi:hypothetical protein
MGLASLRVNARVSRSAETDATTASSDFVVQGIVDPTGGSIDVRATARSTRRPPLPRVKM